MIKIWVLVILMHTPSSMNSSNAAGVTIEQHTASACDTAMKKALRMPGTYTAYCLPAERLASEMKR